VQWEKHKHHKGNTDILLDASNEVGLEVERKLSNFLFKNAGQNHHLMITYKSSEMWQSSNVW
jgi:hypothetical protein